MLTWLFSRSRTFLTEVESAVVFQIWFAPADNPPHQPLPCPPTHLPTKWNHLHRIYIFARLLLELDAKASQPYTTTIYWEIRNGIVCIGSLLQNYEDLRILSSSTKWSVAKAGPGGRKADAGAQHPHLGKDVWAFLQLFFFFSFQLYLTSQWLSAGAGGGSKSRDLRYLSIFILAESKPCHEIKCFKANLGTRCHTILCSYNKQTNTMVTLVIYKMSP